MASVGRAGRNNIAHLHKALTVTSKPVTIHSKLLTFVFLTTLFGCNSQADKQKSNLSGKTADCKPYFSYDKVEHYYFDISEDAIMKIQEKEKKSDKETKQLELLIQYTPDKLSDTTVLENIDKIGFVKKEVPKSKFDQLDQILCERKHKEALAMSCIAIYRDILVFKQNWKIVGTAKLCFECDQNVITGTTRNTEEFGQSGDYRKLYKLLH